MGRDLHKTAFDEGTKLKLCLYEAYIKEWLPVFLSKRRPIYNPINIFDFFAGPGGDSEGTKGSPIIAIEALYPYLSNIILNSLTVNLYFNDSSVRKINKLKKTISTMGMEDKPFDIHYSTRDSQEAFDHYFPFMVIGNATNFLFLDQSGIKQITTPVFKRIIALPTTDFLFFISSSTINRFYDHPEIKKYIDISEEAILSRRYLHIHRVVLDYYRSLIPESDDLQLIPFTIKKGSNIYGLIFGSRHVLGIEKFLCECWKVDPQRGEANFDIDKDGIKLMEPSLFTWMDKPKRLQVFEDNLAQEILEQRIRTNKEIYSYTLQSGFLPQHARNVVGELIKRKKLPKQRLNISYTSCKKNAAGKNILYS